MLKLKLKKKAPKKADGRSDERPRKPKDAATLRSLPEDLVLAPQTEPPRHLSGHDHSGPHSRIRELTWAQFDAHVQALARTVRKAFKADAVVGVAHGGVFVGGALASALKLEFFPVRISRRSRDKGGRSTPRLYGQMPKELKGRNVLIVDDISSSGDTLELAIDLLRRLGAKDVRTATLVAREGGFAPNFAALTSDEIHVFPWDYDAVTEDARFDVDPDKAGA